MHDTHFQLKSNEKSRYMDAEFLCDKILNFITASMWYMTQGVLKVG